MNKSFLERMLSPEQVQAHRQHLKDVMEPVKTGQEEVQALKIKALTGSSRTGTLAPGKVQPDGRARLYPRKPASVHTALGHCEPDPEAHLKNAMEPKIDARIIVKPGWGVEVHTAAQQAIGIANRLGQPVEFSFNPPDPDFDDTLTVYPQDKVERLVDWALSGKQERLKRYDPEALSIDTKADRVYRALEGEFPGKYNFSDVQRFICENSENLLPLPLWAIVNLIEADD
jgi:hypothetical protein